MNATAIAGYQKSKRDQILVDASSQCLIGDARVRFQQGGDMRQHSLVLTYQKNSKASAKCFFSKLASKLLKKIGGIPSQQGEIPWPPNADSF
jgi:hypothetical protein